MKEQKNLNYFFGLKTNDCKVQEQLEKLSWEFFKHSELYQENLKTLNTLKQDQTIKIYLQYCDERMKKLQKVNMASTEEEKKWLIQEATFYTQNIHLLEKDEKAFTKIKEYHSAQENCRRFQTTLNQISQYFKAMQQSYRPVYLVDEIKTHKNKLTYLSHEAFSREKLVLIVEDPYDRNVDFSALFWIRTMKESEPFVGERRWFCMEEKKHFNAEPELWFAEGKTPFKDNQGEECFKRLLFPTK